MKKVLFLSLLIFLLSCSEETGGNIDIPIPNGNFESWDGEPLLLNWKTNSCPSCVPPFETYIVQQSDSAFSGKYAAKLIFNGVYPAYAENKFAIPQLPSLLTAYVKADVANADSVLIKISLFKNDLLVGSDSSIITASLPGFTRVDIPVTATHSPVDSASIYIRGGNQFGTQMWVDDLKLIANQ